MSDARPIQTDALSLTLPSAKGLARKLRKQWPPKGAWWLCWVAFAVVAGVIDWLSNHTFGVLIDMYAAGFYWRSYVKRVPAFSGPKPAWWWTGCAVLVFGVIWQIVSGWK